MLRQLKDPEYTGANRCIPCTVGNVAIAIVTSVALAVLSYGVGVVFFIGAATIIYFKGYLIPGTPAFTKQYFPQWLLRAFGKEPRVASGLSAGNHKEEGADFGLGTESGTGVDVEEVLVTWDLVEATASGDDLRLTPLFRDEWHSVIDSIHDITLTASQVATALGVDMASSQSLNQRGGAYSLVVDDETVGRWPSRPALLADMAAAQLLGDRVKDWNEYPPQERGVVLNGLRVFLEQCPGSEGAVSLRQETVESYCTSQEVVAATCEETGERIFEQPL